MVTLGFSIFLVLIGAALLIFGIFFLREGFSSRSWPQTDAEIDRVRVRSQRSSSQQRTSTRWVVEVSYSYRVGNERHTSRRYSLGDGPTYLGKGFRDRDGAEELASDVRALDRLGISYDPDDPASAVISTGVSIGTWVPLLLGLFFLPVGVILFFALSRSA